MKGVWKGKCPEGTGLPTKAKKHKRDWANPEGEVNRSMRVKRSGLSIFCVFEVKVKEANHTKPLSHSVDAYMNWIQQDFPQNSCPSSWNVTLSGTWVTGVSLVRVRLTHLGLTSRVIAVLPRRNPELGTKAESEVRPPQAEEPEELLPLQDTGGRKEGLPQTL